MQILQLLFVLSAVGLNILSYYLLIDDMVNCEPGSCGGSSLIVLFVTPIVLVVSSITLVLAKKKKASQSATPDELKSARFIEIMSLFSILFAVLPLFAMPFILVIFEFFAKLF